MNNTEHAAIGLNAHLVQVAWSPRQGNKTEKGIQTFRVSETPKGKQTNTEKRTFFNILLPSLSSISFHFGQLLPKMPFSPPRKPLGELSLDPGQRGSGLSLLAAVLPKLVMLSFKTSIIFFYAPGHERVRVHTHTCAHPDTHIHAHADTHTHVNAHTRACAHTHQTSQKEEVGSGRIFPSWTMGVSWCTLTW